MRRNSLAADGYPPARSMACRNWQSNGRLRKGWERSLSVRACVCVLPSVRAGLFLRCQIMLQSGIQTKQNATFASDFCTRRPWTSQNRCVAFNGFPFVTKYSIPSPPPLPLSVVPIPSFSQNTPDPMLGSSANNVPVLTKLCCSKIPSCILSFGSGGWCRTAMKAVRSAALAGPALPVGVIDWPGVASSLWRRHSVAWSPQLCQVRISVGRSTVRCLGAVC